MSREVKGNQTMQFGQLIDYTMRNISFFFFFFEKLYTKLIGVASSRPFSGKLTLSISQDQ